MLLVWSGFHYDGHCSEKYFQNLEYALGVAKFFCVFIFFSPFFLILIKASKKKIVNALETCMQVESGGEVKTTAKNPVNNPPTFQVKWGRTLIMDLVSWPSMISTEKFSCLRQSCFLTACVYSTMSAFTKSTQLSQHHLKIPSLCNSTLICISAV